MNLPTPMDLDGQRVIKHLLGKDVQAAVALLEDNSWRYSEDYLWMGPEAFCYYAPALVQFLRSKAADGESLFPYSMLSTFRFRLDRDGAAIKAAIPIIREFYEIVRNEGDRLGLDADYQRRAHNRIREIEARIEKI